MEIKKDRIYASIMQFLYKDVVVNTGVMPNTATTRKRSVEEHTSIVCFA